MYKLVEFCRGLPGAALKALTLAALALGGVLLLENGALAFTQEQVNKGQETFRLQCARCHGPNGQGMADVYKGLTAPQLIGPGALTVNPRPYQVMRHFQFHTVSDIYDFASAVMPADQPASLTAGEYWDIISYILDANGEQPNGEQLNEADAGRMSLAKLQQRLGNGGSVSPALDNGGGTGGPNTPVIEGQQSK
jgi:mono/diheme cytochrome c family protein